MYYRNQNIRSFYMMDMDNLESAQLMLEKPEKYLCPCDPQQDMSPMLMRDMMDVVRRACELVGGWPDRITWWVELECFRGQLIEVTDYNELGE